MCFILADFFFLFLPLFSWFIKKFVSNICKYRLQPIHSKKADRFFAVVALRFLKYAEPEISHSKSNVL